MDKYTVDLDQVLNDFEYSELTDHYNESKIVKNCNVPQNGASGSGSQNNLVKHSITNVFHSLNEYLNSDITPKYDNSQISQTIYDTNLSEVQKESFNNVNYSLDNNVTPTCNVYNCNVKDSNVNANKNYLKSFEKELLNLQPPEDNKYHGSKEEEKKTIKYNNTSFEFNDSVNEILLNLSINENDKTDNTIKVIDPIVKNESASVLNNSCKEDMEPVNTIQKDELVDISHVANPFLSENIIENDSVVIQNVDLKLEISELKENEHISDEGIEQKSTLSEVNINNIDIKQPIKDNEVITNGKEPKVEVKDDCVEGTGDFVTGNVIEEKIAEVPNDVTEKIGFQSDIEIEDSELDKYLEELEQEFKSQSGGDNATTDKVDAIEDNKSHIQDFGCEEPKKLLEESVIMNQPSKNTELIPSVVDSVSSEPKEALVLENNESVITNVSEQHNKLIEDDRECHTKTDDNKTEDSDSLLARPHVLPLSETEETKREINLIGDPGSTPYNNVYINKEIPKTHDKHHESDTECSSSASPTFSDASSDTSTASTASTEPVHDENEREKLTENDPAEEAVVVEDTNKTSEMSNSNSNMDRQDQAAEVEESGAIACETNESNDKETEREQKKESNVHSETRIPQSPVGDWIGKEAPLWIPDAEALACLHCDMKFTVLKRRHHCRACGLVLCAKCCNLRFRLPYLDAEARVCQKCYNILLNKDSSSSSESSPDSGNSPAHRPNPKNPAEYCSTIPPLQQVSSSNTTVPAIVVPVGVLKREGSAKSKSNKSVMFCDGIRPGSDLTNLDSDFNYNTVKTMKKDSEKQVVHKPNTNLPIFDTESKSFIPANENDLPPTVTVFKTDISYSECANTPSLVEMLKNETLTFAINVNVYVTVQIINMDCCINKIAWCFSTQGLMSVGQDEIIILLEYIEGESAVPKDIFKHINMIYLNAVKGATVNEMNLSLHSHTDFLDSKSHAGFVYVKPTFQCLQKVILPKEPYLIGILIHKWETPWAKLFPLRLILRLGAEYRYYPSPIISTRHRDSVFVEIGHTIIQLLADFRNFSFTLPQIRGLTIHMEDKNTTINIPSNRYDQVMKCMNNSSDHILAFGGNFSRQADSHLVCIQDTQGNENCYSTHAINIHNKPRKVTGASFIVFNGALKSSSGLTAKSNIVEDGLMIQILPEHMVQIRENLRNMKNHTIQCGCVNAVSDETVNIVWGENDLYFNIGVLSPIDNMEMNGIPSIRAHNARDYVCNSGNRFIRWTEVFILQNGEEASKSQDPVDLSKVAEAIAKATCAALVKYLDLLATNNFYKIGIRTTLHIENVSYLAGSNNMKLPPIYMKSLDNELIPVLHRVTSNSSRVGDNAIVLELIFRILNM